MKRNRISTTKFMKGDIVRAKIIGNPIPHICIILEDEPNTGHVKCLSVCNITGSAIPKNEYSIDISKYDLPSNWFEHKKVNSWIRCNEIDCLFKLEIQPNDKLGNILTSFPELWSEVCKAVHNCPIAKRLENICDCEFEIIEKEIKLGIKQINDCGCT